ncbi:hypothetical protein [Nocardia sp. BMG51109]|uniref:hypothetical protein n=1 Tax=Nocardia sp. BMG51109 TaxID=1056816 RepID=UPI00046743E9|nr:hypothetical protein [Nocardia sp. BMG51109]
MTKTIFACAVAAGALLMAAPAASADPAPEDPYGWNEYRDWTSGFVSAFDPGAYFDPAKTSKRLVVSPYGTGRPIECRGDGHYVWPHDCRQYDDNGVPHNLNAVAVPVRQLFVYQ